MTDSHRYNHHHRVRWSSSYCQNGLSGARMKFMVIHCGQNISLFGETSEMEISLNRNQCKRTCQSGYLTLMISGLNGNPQLVKSKSPFCLFVFLFFFDKLLFRSCDRCIEHRNINGFSIYR
ncbi:hypothetical protein CEXT_748511 [Caerostris extrusa]|uniref:Uncharacterized protein n=1 Tax=Caerostris extrusa TaxID=172846 RepID=A0AAV4NB60_CAEEX|nr:hypothetical protein CEXT_748511 [Caerostris extrusa]